MVPGERVTSQRPDSQCVLLFYLSKYAIDFFYIISMTLTLMNPKEVRRYGVRN